MTPFHSNWKYIRRQQWERLKQQQQQEQQQKPHSAEQQRRLSQLNTTLDHGDDEEKKETITTPFITITSPHTHTHTLITPANDISTTTNNSNGIIINNNINTTQYQEQHAQQQLAYELTLHSLIFLSPSYRDYLFSAYFLLTAFHITPHKERKRIREKWRDMHADQNIERLSLVKGNILSLLLTLSSASASLKDNFSSVSMYTLYMSSRARYYHTQLLALTTQIQKEQEEQQHLAYQQYSIWMKARRWLTGAAPMMYSDAHMMDVAKKHTAAFWHYYDGGAVYKDGHVDGEGVREREKKMVHCYGMLLYHLIALPNEQGRVYTIHTPPALSIKTSASASIAQYNPSADLSLPDTKQSILISYQYYYGLTPCTVSLLYLQILLMNLSAHVMYMQMLSSGVRHMLDVVQREGMMVEQESQCAEVMEGVCEWCMIIIAYHQHLIQQHTDVPNATAVTTAATSVDIEKHIEEKDVVIHINGTAPIASTASASPPASASAQASTTASAVTEALSLFQYTWTWLEKHLSRASSNALATPAFALSSYVDAIMESSYQQRYTWILNYAQQYIHPSSISSASASASAPSITTRTQLLIYMQLLLHDIKEEQRIIGTTFTTSSSAVSAATFPSSVFSALSNLQTRIYMRCFIHDMASVIPDMSSQHDHQKQELLPLYKTLLQFVHLLTSSASASAAEMLGSASAIDSIREWMSPIAESMLPSLIHSIETSAASLAVSRRTSTIDQLQAFCDGVIQQMDAMPLNAEQQSMLCKSLLSVINRWIDSRDDAPSASASSAVTLLVSLHDTDAALTLASSLYTHLHLLSYADDVLSTLHTDQLLTSLTAFAQSLAAKHHFTAVIHQLVNERPVDLIWDYERVHTALTSAELTALSADLPASASSSSAAAASASPVLTALMCVSVLAIWCQSVDAEVRTKLHSLSWEDAWSSAQLTRLQQMITIMHTQLSTITPLLPPLPSTSSPSSASASASTDIPIIYRAWVHTQQDIITDAIQLLSLLLSPSSTLITLFNEIAPSSSMTRSISAARSVPAVPASASAAASICARLHVDAAALYDALFCRARREHDNVAMEFVKHHNRPSISKK